MLMEALQMLKFNFKKARLNFMSEWQSPLVAEDKEGWLWDLAKAIGDRRTKFGGKSESCELRLNTWKCQRKMIDNVLL
jgi:hypothetical protein